MSYLCQSQATLGWRKQSIALPPHTCIAIEPYWSRTYGGRMLRCHVVAFECSLYQDYVSLKKTVFLNFVQGGKEVNIGSFCTSKHLAFKCKPRKAASR